MRVITVSLAGLLVLGAAAQAAEQMAAPVLQFDGAADVQVEGRPFVRYKLSVVNRSSFAAELFAPEPDLPPCGANKDASRTWLNVHDGDVSGARLYGFCALRSADELGELSFTLPKDRKPPSSVYIALTDRQAKETVTSNQVAIGEPVDLVLIDRPRLGDLRLDWCREWARQCGKAAADEFCRRQGFAEATAFARASRVGEPTRVIGTGQVCNNPTCDGFASITCRRTATAPGQCDASVHPDQRIAVCTRLIEGGGAANETLANAYLYRCDAYGFKGNYDQALADCTRAIELNPAEPRAFAMRSRIHAAKRRYDLAIQDMSDAIRLRPQEAGLYYNRGTTHEAAGQPDRAIEDYSEAIRLDPKQGQFYISRGIAYSNGNRLAEALADFNAVIGINPKSHVAYFNRGSVYRKMGEPARAIADYDEALRLQPKYLLAHLRRADTYGDDMQQYDRAVQGYSQAIALSPKDPFIVYLRARAYTEGGRYGEALADHGEALKIAPQFALAFNGRAWTYFKMGKAADGLPDVERALELQPELAHAYKTRAHIYEALGRKDEAIADFRRALARMPAHQPSLEGLKRLGAAP